MGKGEVIFIGFDIFSFVTGKMEMLTGLANQGVQKWFWPENLLNAVIKGMINPEFHIEGKGMYTTFYKDGMKNYIHFLNTTPESGKRGCRISGNKIKGGKMLYPEKTELKKENNAVALPEIEIYAVVEIEYEK